MIKASRELSESAGTSRAMCYQLEHHHMMRTRDVDPVSEGDPQSFARRSRRLLLGLSAFLVTATLSVGQLEARQPTVILGEVTLAEVQRSDLGNLLRGAVREELDKSGVTSLRARQRYILSARLVKLQSKPEQRIVRSTAVVSLVLRKTPTDNLHAVANGKATVQENVKYTRDAENAALRAAVQTAMQRVSQAIASEG